MSRILVVDDEPKICEAIHDYLTFRGLQVVTACDGQEALRQCENTDFDLILMDVMMPKMNGMEACQAIRSFSEVPVLFLSALGEEQNLLNAYHVGADDYMIKPVPLAILAEKCKAMIARYRGVGRDDRLIYGDLELCISKMQVKVQGEVLNITGKNFQLLQLLMQNPDLVLSRETILSRIWGWDFEGDIRVVDNHVKRLRRSLGKEAEHIQTRVGCGYVFCREVEQ